jgi:O-antigen/teichoic acid export membrane protein
MSLLAVVDGINKAWAPYYYKIMTVNANPEGVIVKYVSMYLWIILLLCIAGILFSSEIFQFAFPPQYFSAVPYVAPVLLGYFFIGLYQFANKPLFFFKKTKIIPFITGFAALLNIGLNLIFIPKFGAIAAAWTTAFSYGCCFILFFISGRRHQKIGYPLNKCGILIIALLVVTFMTRDPTIWEIKVFTGKVILILAYTWVSYRWLIFPYINMGKVKKAKIF